MIRKYIRTIFHIHKWVRYAAIFNGKNNGTVQVCTKCGATFIYWDEPLYL